MYIHLQYWFKVNKLAKIWHVFSFGSREEYEPSIFWILLPRPILHKTHLENTRTIFREHLQSVPTSTRRHFCPYFKDIKVWYFYWREIVFVAIISPASAFAADSVSNCIKICRDFQSLPSPSSSDEILRKTKSNISWAAAKITLFKSAMFLVKTVPAKCQSMRNMYNWPKHFILQE